LPTKGLRIDNKRQLRNGEVTKGPALINCLLSPEVSLFMHYIGIPIYKTEFKTYI